MRLLLPLLALFALAHFDFLKRHERILLPVYGDKSFEDIRVHLGDSLYYGQAVRSLLTDRVEDKFNHSASMDGKLARELNAEDFPRGAKALLAFYPFPTTKSGYTLTAAGLTGWLPDSIFARQIRRLTLVNFILNLLSVVLVFFLVRQLMGGSALAGFFAGIFFILDFSNAYNSYAYQSHTACGVFYFLLAATIAVRKEIRTARWAFLFALALSAAVMASPHVLYLAAVYGALSFALSFSLPAALAGAAGAVIFPAYYFIVEAWLDFAKLGIPTLAEQAREYQRASYIFLQDFPLQLRFLWAPRLFHYYAFVVFAVAVGLFVFSRLNRVRFEGLERRKVFVLGAAGVLSFLVSAVHGLPVSRAATPYTLIAGIGLGAWLGLMWGKGWAARGYVASIVILTSLSFLRFSGRVPTPMEAPAGRIVQMRTEDRRLSIESFLRKHGVRDDAPTFLMFEPFDLISNYLSHRRFFRKVVESEPPLVTPELYREDFPLLLELFGRLRGRPGAVQTVGRRLWWFPYWDQEYHFLLGYHRRLLPFLEGTSLAGIDPRLIYFLDLRELLDADAPYASARE